MPGTPCSAPSTRRCATSPADARGSGGGRARRALWQPPRNARPAEEPFAPEHVRQQSPGFGTRGGHQPQAERTIRPLHQRRFDAQLRRARPDRLREDAGQRIAPDALGVDAVEIRLGRQRERERDERPVEEGGAYFLAAMSVERDHHAVRAHRALPEGGTHVEAGMDTRGGATGALYMTGVGGNAVPVRPPRRRSRSASGRCARRTPGNPGCRRTRRHSRSAGGRSSTGR